MLARSGRLVITNFDEIYFNSISEADEVSTVYTGFIE
jgi:hypothetical protein